MTLIIPETVPKLKWVAELLINQRQYLQCDVLYRGGFSSQFHLCLKFCTENCRTEQQVTTPATPLCHPDKGHTWLCIIWEAHFAEERTDLVSQVSSSPHKHQDLPDIQSWCLWGKLEIYSKQKLLKEQMQPVSEPERDRNVGKMSQYSIVLLQRFTQ